MDKKTKIWRLLNGIWDPIFAPVKTIIHTTPNLRNDFKEAVAVLTTAVQEASNKAPNRYNISSVQSQSNQRGTRRGGFRGGQGGRTQHFGGRGRGGHGGRGRGRGN